MTLPIFLNLVLADQALIWLLALIGIDLFFGVTAALVTKTFALPKLADFVEHTLVPYLVAYIGLSILALLQPGLAVARDFVYAALILALSGSIVKSLNDLGVPIPLSLLGTLTGKTTPVVGATVTQPPPVQNQVGGSQGPTIGPS